MFRQMTGFSPWIRSLLIPADSAFCGFDSVGGNWSEVAPLLTIKSYTTHLRVTTLCSWRNMASVFFPVPFHFPQYFVLSFKPFLFTASRFLPYFSVFICLPLIFFPVHFHFPCFSFLLLLEISLALFPTIPLHHLPPSLAINTPLFSFSSPLHHLASSLTTNTSLFSFALFYYPCR